MKHEECMKTDAEYKRTYDLMKEHEMSLEKILEVVVKSNGIVGVGIVSLKGNIEKQLVELMQGY